MSVWPVILSGGAGTRLWPLSRSLYPKQFLKLWPDDDRSMLEATLARLPNSEAVKPPLVVCNNDHRFLVSDCAEEASIPLSEIVLEPVGRNTAPAIAVAALLATESDPDAILVVMPSDHVIAGEAQFRVAVAKAVEVAATGKLVLFGISPDRPHTGYGYIAKGEALPGFGESYKVARFVEKPDEETAAGYLAEGNYYWNSGIFVLHAQTLIDELTREQPEVIGAARDALDGAERDLNFLRLDEPSFAASPSISIDNGVMEHTGKAAMLPIDVGWSDVGSWSSLAELGKADAQGNVLAGFAASGEQTVLQDTSNCFVYSTGALVSTIGLDNLVIVETPDALLVADKARAQEVGKIVERLKSGDGRQHEQHLRHYRPWGYFEQLNQGDRFQVKLLHVKPGGKLSMQMHHHRSEHWVVVRGTALVSAGTEEKLVHENESFYISATEWHRLANPGKLPLVIIEVQLGSYLGEDDIIRENDIYNRGQDETN
ncbi:mannose-1-phosphate guanylyltransferase/mannose-6-phosphate isomerase [Methyloligella sp. 2.7D]|uniref:mannose-1-phosphate guanylyltransferase/mannose-6-phosphate isomerase n=1 Tax=unclassified Methyloligella TaxID=2625955 RepID=UPI00157BE3B9|nr:mannose-1-phosphate guanylyltransferase/mannose-6-phosphate isomerase [Methyloligella sp. GL2]QKP77694.1 mannose-1-phosphate guanylyltransferase/mannose-6-phosphate isomerase [Methyloligella sp. GL2]